MEPVLQAILNLRKKHQFTSEITVTGDSMEPFLKEADIVSIQPCGQYCPGDILIYPYKGELLIHRLLFVKNGKWYCKGDNAFRLEDVFLNDILGKVIAARRGDSPVSFHPKNMDRFLELSAKVSAAFRKCGYDKEKTKNTEIYQAYCKERSKNDVKEK